ncbi:hypothetical protein JKP88DRAFT_304037 [Tribonema minus]|uniref:EF-hand domain-containing protein n=1 Tax=Tribonema minus TaxID=303371 RepID=A0A836CKE2_9STRA|nr:hypothetical protein JKP88DRAFT_304037 [Tribonema minus]
MRRALWAATGAAFLQCAAGSGLPSTRLLLDAAKAIREDPRNRLSATDLQRGLSAGLLVAQQGGSCAESLACDVLRPIVVFLDCLADSRESGQSVFDAAFAGALHDACACREGSPQIPSICADRSTDIQRRLRASTVLTPEYSDPYGNMDTDALAALLESGDSSDPTTSVVHALCGPCYRHLQSGAEALLTFAEGGDDGGCLAQLSLDYIVDNEAWPVVLAEARAAMRLTCLHAEAPMPPPPPMPPALPAPDSAAAAAVAPDDGDRHTWCLGTLREITDAHDKSVSVDEVVSALCDPGRDVLAGAGCCVREVMAAAQFTRFPDFWFKLSDACGLDLARAPRCDAAAAAMPSAAAVVSFTARVAVSGVDVCAEPDTLEAARRAAARALGLDDVMVVVSRCSTTMPRALFGHVMVDGASTVSFTASATGKLQARHMAAAQAQAATPDFAASLAPAIHVDASALRLFPGDARAEQRLRALYRAHDGAAQGAVDLREIAAGALLLRQHRLIRESPRQLLVALCELFTKDGGELLARSDALKVVSLAATTATDVYLTAGKMDRHLEEMAASYNLKPTFKMLPVSPAGRGARDAAVSLDLFLDVLDTHTALLSAIASTMWARVPAQWRLTCLQEAEDAGIGRLSAALSAIKAARAAAHRRRALVGAHWRAWRRFAERCRVERHQRETVLRCRCAAAARRWRRRARAAARMARLRNAAAAMGAGRILRLRLAQLRAATAEAAQRLRRGALAVSDTERCLRRCGRAASARHRVTRALWTSSAAGKRVLLGVARWRAVERRARQRSALRRWCETASLMSAWDFAVATSGERPRRRAFRALRAYVAHALSQRRLETEAEARAAAVVEIAAKAEADAVALALAEEAQERARRAARKAALVAAKAAEAARAKEAEAAAGVARERAVLQEQQAARRQRVRDQAAAALEQHKAYWAVHTEELVAAARRRRCEWLSGGGGDAARYEVEKGVAALRRRFLAAPSPETAQLERALADPANIVFAFVASRLWSRHVTLRDFFNEFDVEHDGYLAPAEFETLVASLGIQLDGEKVRAMTRSIDADGGGLIDCDEFQAAMARHEQVCGHAGSPWKMYVSPVHGVMTLHSIETGEQRLDSVL